MYTARFFKPTLLIIALALGTVSAHAERLQTHDGEQSIHPATLAKLDSLKNIPEVSLKVPAMQRFHTSTGVPVMFTAIHELPIIDINITFHGGSSKDAIIKRGSYGLSSMVATMLTQGTKNLDEDAFAEAMEQLGAGFAASSSLDFFDVDFRGLSDASELEPALDLFIDALANPAFDTEVLTRNQARMAQLFLSKKEEPAYLAHLQFLKAIYASHPYAYRSHGTPDGVASITRDDLLAYKARYLVRDNAHITITGNLSQTQAQDIAERIAAALPQGEKASHPSHPAATKKAHYHIPYDISQTNIMIGHLGERYSNDPAAMQARLNFSLGNAVLAGGDFNSRLMKEIREKGGYTYGISGSMSRFNQAGYYQISFATQEDKATDAINQTLDIIRDTLDTGIQAHEFELERTSALHAYPMSLATNSAIHGTAVSMLYRDLPDSYMTDRLTRLKNSSLDHANAALKSQIHPDDFIIVTIGKSAPKINGYDTVTIVPADTLLP